jgi:hypothetical protein
MTYRASAPRTVNVGVDPSANDDLTLGFRVADLWVNTSTDNVFVCVDASISAAIWDPADADSLLASQAPEDVTKVAATVGTSNRAARGDHKHDIATGVPANTLAPSISNTEGSATTLARSDHTHQIATAAPTSGIGAANSEGSAEAFARADHDHKLRESGGQDLTIGSISTDRIVKRSAAALVGGALEADIVLRDGSVPFTGDVDLGTNRVTNVGSPAGDSDVATRGYVRPIVVSIGSAESPYVAMDREFILVATAGGPVVVNLPSAPTAGDLIRIKKSDAAGAAVTISGNGATLDGAGTYLLTDQYDCIAVVYGAAQWWIE